MKLLLCLKCQDIFNLTQKKKTCSCGETAGNYIDNLNAEISGDCMPIGFSNPSVQHAFKIQRIEDKHYDGNKDTCCKGAEFSAFFIPSWATSIKRINKKQK